MRIFSLATKVAVFLLLFGFAVKNTDGVTLRYFGGLEWQAPLALVLLVMFAAGVFAGILTGIGKIASQRRELTALKRELGNLSRARPGIPVEAV